MRLPICRLNRNNQWTAASDNHQPELGVANAVTAKNRYEASTRIVVG